MAYKKQIKLGVKFSVKLPNSREQEFEVSDFNEHTFDVLGTEITNTTSYAPPEAFVVDKTRGIIKLVFNDNIPQATPLEIIVFGIVAEKKVTTQKKVLFSDEKVQAIKDTPKSMAAWLWALVKTSVAAFIIASLLLFFIKDTKPGAIINKLWVYINAAKIVEIAENFDARIITNSHPVYKTGTFLEFNKIYQKTFNTEENLKGLYAFVGNDFFVTKDLIKDDSGFVLQDREGAASYCAMMGGRLLNIMELKVYLAKQYANIENFLWPVALRPGMAEWSETKQSFYDNYWIYLKKDKKTLNIIEGMPTKDGFISVDEDDFDLSFRCGFEARTYLP